MMSTIRAVSDLAVMGNHVRWGRSAGLSAIGGAYMSETLPKDSENILARRIEMVRIITGGIIYLILVITLGVMSIRKGRRVMFIIGFFLPFFWLIGALMPSRRLAF